MSHGASPTYTEAQMLAALNRVYAACGSCSQDDYAALPSEADRSRWILLLAHTLHSKQRGLPISICTFIIEERVRAAQKGEAMNRPNIRAPRVAASGTAEEFFGHVAEADPLESAPADRRYDRGVLPGAMAISLLILGLAFWPVVVEWLTPFTAGVLVGVIGTAVVLIGGLVVGVCLGAGRLEKSQS